MAFDKDPVYGRTHDATNWDDADGAEVNDKLGCLTNDLLAVTCFKLGKPDDDICRLEFAEDLNNLQAGDTIRVHNISKHNFDDLACIPYNTAAGVDTANKIVVTVVVDTPSDMVLTTGFIGALHDLDPPNGKWACRLVEDLASPIAGDLTVTEVEAELTTAAAVQGIVPIRRVSYVFLGGEGEIGRATFFPRVNFSGAFPAAANPVIPYRLGKPTPAALKLDGADPSYYPTLAFGGTFPAEAVIPYRIGKPTPEKPLLEGADPSYYPTVMFGGTFPAEAVIPYRVGQWFGDRAPPWEPKAQFYPTIPFAVPPASVVIVYLMGKPTPGEPQLEGADPSFYPTIPFGGTFPALPVVPYRMGKPTRKEPLLDGADPGYYPTVMFSGTFPAEAVIPYRVGQWFGDERPAWEPKAKFYPTIIFSTVAPPTNPVIEYRIGKPTAEKPLLDGADPHFYPTIRFGGTFPAERLIPYRMGQ